MFDCVLTSKLRKNGHFCSLHCDYSSLLYDKLESFLVLLTRSTFFFTVLFNSQHAATHPVCTLDPTVFQESFCLSWSRGDLGRGHIAGFLGIPIWKHSLLFLLKKIQSSFLKTMLHRNPWVIAAASSWISPLNINHLRRLCWSPPNGGRTTSRQLVKELLWGEHRSSCLSIFFVKIKGASVSIIFSVKVWKGCQSSVFLAL